MQDVTPAEPDQSTSVRDTQPTALHAKQNVQSANSRVLIDATAKAPLPGPQHREGDISIWRCHFMEKACRITSISQRIGKRIGSRIMENGGVQPARGAGARVPMSRTSMFALIDSVMRLHKQSRTCSAARSRLAHERTLALPVASIQCASPAPKR